MLAISPALTPGWWTGRLRLVPGPEVHVRLTAHNSRATYEIGDPPGWPDGRPVPMTIPSGARMFVFSFLAIGTVQRIRVAVVSHDRCAWSGQSTSGRWSRRRGCDRPARTGMWPPKRPRRPGTAEHPTGRRAGPGAARSQGPVHNHDPAPATSMTNRPLSAGMSSR